MFLSFIIILVISTVFSMFGKGGGSLYTPVLVMMGLPLDVSIVTALFLNLVTAMVATIVFARNKLVDFKFCGVFLPGTIIGSLVGALLSSRAPRELLLGIFSVFLYGAGALMAFSKKEIPGQAVKSLTVKLIVLIVGFSLGVGVLSSLIGVGGGLVIFPFLVLYMKYPAQKAAGANSFIVAVSSLVGTAGHFASTHASLPLMLITSVACVLGSAVGSHVTVKASPAFVKIAFAFVMWFFATQIALKLLGIL